ncbi:MAG TPA: hypothetical protein PKZ81_00940 [Clostridia bacterium]|nr:hypothetical protein [Clostridia bacterium]
MAYSEKSAARLAALHGEIEARKEHEFAAPTYRDAAALAEIRQTVFNQLESEHEHDRDTVEDSIAVLRYLAENYENMGRTACALPLRKKVLELDAEFAARFGNSEAFVDENTEEASAVREGIGLLLRIKGAQSLRKGRMCRPAGDCGGASAFG